MQNISVEQVIEQTVKKDPRYHKDAYEFVREALDFTIKKMKKNAAGKERHVSGKELLEGVRGYAIQEYGPLAHTLLAYWNLHRCEDIGEIVFNMVDRCILKATENDSREDFKDGYDFEKAFCQPFQFNRQTETSLRPRVTTFKPIPSSS